jgi:uncharacterized membrane protein YgcG
MQHDDVHRGATAYCGQQAQSTRKYHTRRASFSPIAKCLPLPNMLHSLLLRLLTSFLCNLHRFLVAHNLANRRQRRERRAVFANTAQSELRCAGDGCAQATRSGTQVMALASCSRSAADVIGGGSDGGGGGGEGGGGSGGDGDDEGGSGGPRTPPPLDRRHRRLAAVGG